MSNTITGNISIEATLNGTITIGGGGSDTLAEAMSETGLAEYEFDDTVIHPVIVKKVTAPNATVLADDAFVNSWVEEVDAEKVVTVGEGAFYSASFLKHLTLGKITSVGNRAFYSMGASENNDIELHLDVNAIAYNDSTFYRAKLKSLTVDSLATINGSVFNDMVVSGDLSFPNVTEIGTNGLQSVTCNTLSLPNVITVGSNGFRFSKIGSKSIELPSVTTIDTYAFRSANITDLYLPGDTMCVLGDVVSNVFMSCPIYTDSNARVHVPASMESTYKADIKWSAITDKIVGDL